ncbi:hypothetical protein [Natronorubrum sp. FCH18a]|uniref:hypothetical protein n=1 Tax=Natronorubrum sp. FCH18a TaxID=3447018 RepID=UPI003F5175E1
MRRLTDGDTASDVLAEYLGLLENIYESHASLAQQCLLPHGSVSKDKLSTVLTVELLVYLF